MFTVTKKLHIGKVEAGKTSIIDVCDQLLDPELIHGGTVSAAEIDGGVLFQRFHDLLFQNIVCVRNSHPNGRLILLTRTSSFLLLKFRSAQTVICENLLRLKLSHFSNCNEHKH